MHVGRYTMSYSYNFISIWLLLWYLYSTYYTYINIIFVFWFKILYCYLLNYINIPRYLYILKQLDKCINVLIVYPIKYYKVKFFYI